MVHSRQWIQVLPLLKYHAAYAMTCVKLAHLSSSHKHHSELKMENSSLPVYLGHQSPLQFCHQTSQSLERLILAPAVFI